MATPIKTTVLDNLETTIQGIIAKAERHPAKMEDRTSKSFPLCFLFDDDEVKVRRNQVMICTFPLQIEIWTEKQAGMKAISNACDIWQADIEKILMPSTSQARKPAEVKCVHGSPASSKFYADETLGGIVLLYEITYMYPYGKPYELYQ